MLFLATATLLGCGDATPVQPQTTDGQNVKTTKTAQAPAEVLPEIRYYMYRDR